MFCQGGEKEIKVDMPPPKGKLVVLTIYMWMLTMHHVKKQGGLSLGFCCWSTTLQFLGTSKGWILFKTSTYGRELAAARIAIELSMEFRFQIRMLGVGIQEPTIIYGNNQRVVTLCTNTCGKQQQFEQENKQDGGWNNEEQQQIRNNRCGSQSTHSRTTSKG